MSWLEIVDRLRNAVDWGRHSAADVEEIEQVLREVWLFPNVVVEAIDSLCSNRSLFERYLPDMECPRMHMDKFLLFDDEEAGFRIRLHRFPRQTERNLVGSPPTIHDHRWPYSTLILAGSYREELFDAQNTHAQAPARIASELLRAGEIRSLSAGVFHRTVNVSNSEDCLTFFVRGRSRIEHSRVWNEVTHEFVPKYGRCDHVLRALSGIRATLAAPQFVSP